MSIDPQWFNYRPHVPSHEWRSLYQNEPVTYRTSIGSPDNFVTKDYLDNLMQRLSPTTAAKKEDPKMSEDRLIVPIDKKSAFVITPLRVLSDESEEEKVVGIEFQKWLTAQDIVNNGGEVTETTRLVRGDSPTRRIEFGDVQPLINALSLGVTQFEPEE